MLGAMAESLLGRVPDQSVRKGAAVALLVPAVLVAEFFLFLNTGPLNAAIVNSVGAGVRSTAIALTLLLIHALGDAYSPKLIGYISDRHSLPSGLALTLVAMLVAGVILLWGARFAPNLGES